MPSSVLLAVAIWDASHVESLSLSRYDTPKTLDPVCPSDSFDCL